MSNRDEGIHGVLLNWKTSSLSLKLWGVEIRNPRDLFHSALIQENRFHSETIPPCRSHSQSHVFGLWAENGERTGAIRPGSSLRDPERLCTTHQTNQSLAEHTHTDFATFTPTFAGLAAKCCYFDQGEGFAQLRAGIRLLPGRSKAHFKKMEQKHNKVT